MNFTLKGKVIHIQDLVSGTSKGSGNEWSKQSFVIETSGDYPKKVCFTVWGDRIEQLSALSIGNDADVKFKVESREYNDKWYTDLTASEIQNAGGVAAPKAEAPAAPDVDSDDLPF